MVKSSKDFYTELKVEGLADRKKKFHTQKELRYLRKLLCGKNKILDVGCGYGRFAIPLAKTGYEVYGIDITPSFIKKAKSDSSVEKVNARFRLGDMTDLPYRDDSFDAIICMWSVFLELTKKSDQLNAIKEMLRVLRQGGFAFVEMAKPEKFSNELNDKKRRLSFRKSDVENVNHAVISGIEAMPSYRHNKKTLTELMKKSGAKKYKISIEDFGGRDRLLLQFWK